MSFTRFTEETGNISALSDRPNDTEGLSASELKARFDKAGNDVKEYINGELLPALEATTAAGNIGIAAITGLVANTVQEALQALFTALQDVTLGDIPDGSIGTAKMADDAITEDKLHDGAVTKKKLANGAVNAEKIGTGAVGNTKLGNSSVTSEKIAAGAVSDGKIGAAAVGTDNLKANAVTTAKIADANITTPKIADGAVTYVKTSGVQQKHTTVENVAIAPISAGGYVSATVSGVTAGNTVIVSPAPGSFIRWRDCGVRCTGQWNGGLTIVAESATGTTLYANVIILNK